MIKHVVCFKLKQEEKYQINEVKELMLSMKDQIDYLKDLEVGIDFIHSSRSFDIVLQVTLDSKEDLDKYQLDEYHCTKIKALMGKIAENTIAVDYEF